ncbi:hypothetical protein BDV93DRAFT_483319 [Ceratobasidium sp. AG-I]|nr:hypothetical protein BDV93DRAFT_483319 [Ceratobasidium sp. AG-I]
MPELPEVERAAKLMRHVGLGRMIEKVETSEDAIVYTGGITHTEFGKEITGRTVTGVGRYGKVFYVELDGEGRMPVFHLGMTGMIQVKGQEPTWYRRKNKDLSAEIWPPPRFLKFIIHFSATDTEPATQLAFLDARRLARIRLAREPLKEPPISELGFDPILSMPTLEEFKKMVLKRTCPIKALLLDQSFSAGVGNWVADEILYQSKIHPEQRAHNLSEAQLVLIYQNTKGVCETAVAVDADSSQFPANWLFDYRWGKGQKTKAEMLLPSGEVAKIKWLTVGGRTSAVVEQIQIMPAEGRSKKAPRTGSTTETGLSKPAPAKSRKRKAAASSKKEDDVLLGGGGEDESDLTSLEEDQDELEKVETKVTKVAVSRKSSRAKIEAVVETTVARATKRRKIADDAAEPKLKPKPVGRTTRSSKKK